MGKPTCAAGCQGLWAGVQREFGASACQKSGMRAGVCGVCFRRFNETVTVLGWGWGYDLAEGLHPVGVRLGWNAPACPVHVPAAAQQEQEKNEKVQHIRRRKPRVNIALAAKKIFLRLQRTGNAR